MQRFPALFITPAIGISFQKSAVSNQQSAIF